MVAYISTLYRSLCLLYWRRDGINPQQGLAPSLRYPPYIYFRTWDGSQMIPRVGSANSRLRHGYHHDASGALALYNAVW